MVRFGVIEPVGVLLHVVSAQSRASLFETYQKIAYVLADITRERSAQAENRHPEREAKALHADESFGGRCHVGFEI